MTAAGQPERARSRLPQRGSPLSTQERQILRLAAEGHSNGAIGRHLYLSEDTVKTHTRRIYARLGANGRAHAVAIAYQQGLLGEPCSCREGTATR